MYRVYYITLNYWYPSSKLVPTRDRLAYHTAGWSPPNTLCCPSPSNTLQQCACYLTIDDITRIVLCTYMYFEALLDSKLQPHSLTIMYMYM